MFKKISLTIAMILAAGRLWAISVTPSIQNFELKPGESIDGEVLLANTDEEEINVVPTTKNWFLLGDNKKIRVEEWLIMPGEKFTLKPGESKKLAVKVRAPKKAVGELVGMLSFHTRSASRGTVEFILSSAVYLALSGTEKVTGTIPAMTVATSSNAITAGVVVRNTGNVHLRPFGIVQVYNGDNQLIANVELEKGQPVYPANQRAYFGTVKDLTLPPGKYRMQVDLEDFDRRVIIDKQKQKFTVTEDSKIKY